MCRCCKGEALAPSELLFGYCKVVIATEFVQASWVATCVLIACRFLSG